MQKYKLFRYFKRYSDFSLQNRAFLSVFYGCLWIFSKCFHEMKKKNRKILGKTKNLITFATEKNLLTN